MLEKSVDLQWKTVTHSAVTNNNIQQFAQFICSDICAKKAKNKFGEIVDGEATEGTGAMWTL